MANYDYSKERTEARKAYENLFVNTFRLAYGHNDIDWSKVDQLSNDKLIGQIEYMRRYSQGASIPTR